MTRAAAFARIPVGLAGDASGNIGLGVTPNAWYTGSKALQIGTLGLEGRVSGSYSNIFTNAYINADGSNYIYVSSNYATSYKQNNGAHSWSTAPSGTAGGAISFTQAMTLDASGNLGVGTTSPAAYGQFSLYGSLPLQRINGIGSGVFGLYVSTGVSTPTDVVAFTYSSASGENKIGGLQSYVFPTFYSGGSERARITTAGDFCINTTGASFGAKLTVGQDTGEPGILVANNVSGGRPTIVLYNREVAGPAVTGQILFGGFRDVRDPSYSAAIVGYNYSGGLGNSGALAFCVGENGENSVTTPPPERMRIDSSGNLLVGTTSQVHSTPHRTNISFDNNVSWGLGIKSASSGTSQMISFVNASGSVQGSIYCNGTTTSYNTSSDYRLKNITGPVAGARDFIMALQPKQGTWKSDGSPFVGFLAHEFQAVSPSSVAGEKDAVDKDGNPIMQAMQASSSEVMANLIAFVQEQQAIIEDVKTRLAAAGI